MRNDFPPELIPAAVAAGAGLAALGAISLFEWRQVDRTTFKLTFPSEVDSGSAERVLRAISGMKHGTEMCFELRAAEGDISYFVSMPTCGTSIVPDKLRGALPALRVEQADDGVPGSSTLAIRVYVPGSTLLQAGDAEAASRVLLAGLARLHTGEQLIVRWTLRTSHFPPAAPASEADKAVLRGLARRRTEPGFTVSGLVLVRAEGVSRARALGEHVAASIRSRRSGGPGLRLSYERARRSMDSLPKVGRRSGWLSAGEIVPLLALPLGDVWYEGVTVGASREVAASRDLQRHGRPLFMARDGRGERPVALSPKAALLHEVVVGPTGTGKSTILARGVLSDLGNDYGGILVDPKADLLQAIIDRVPERDAHRVVVLDPSAAGPVPGLDLLRTGDPDLRADVLVGALRSIFPDWGIRLEIYARLALRTLAEVPGSTLLDFGRLFSDAAFRRTAMARQSDPLTVTAWQAFEDLSPAQQVEHVQAPMARIMALLSRPALRAVLAQPEPKLDIGRLLAERRWLLVNLAPGTLGEPAARLLSAILSFVAWTALESRVSLPEHQRRPVFLVFDELQSLTDLPMSIERIAERARGLGGGLVIGTQTLGRLPEGTRQAVVGNFSTIIAFRSSAEEAAKLGRELPGLTPQDLQALGSYEVAARVATGSGSQVRVVTGRSEALPPVTGQGERIRRQSAERYGVSREDIDAQLRDQQSSDMGTDDIGRARRQA